MSLCLVSSGTHADALSCAFVTAMCATFAQALHFPWYLCQLNQIESIQLSILPPGLGSSGAPVPLHPKENQSHARLQPEAGHRRSVLKPNSIFRLLLPVSPTGSTAKSLITFWCGFCLQNTPSTLIVTSLLSSSRLNGQNLITCRHSVIQDSSFHCAELKITQHVADICCISVTLWDRSWLVSQGVHQFGGSNQNSVGHLEY